MLLSFFHLSLAIRNVWPVRMSWKAFIALYMLLLLAIVTNNVLTGFFRLPFFSPFFGQQSFSLGANLLYLALFYLITLLCGRLLKKLLLTGRGILGVPQTWYLVDAALLLLLTIYLFDYPIPGQNGSVGRMIYNNALHISGYLLVLLFLFLAARCFWLEQIQTETKQKALQDLQDYTNNLEVMYNSLRSFKHDYVNILLSLSGYIDSRDMDGLKKFFEDRIFPTKNLIDQGDYRLNQLGNIGVLEIKSLLSVKMICAHESGIDVTIDIPDRVDNFPIDTVDLARILGIFLDNAIEAAPEAERPQIGLHIIQNPGGVSITISNRFLDHGAALHQFRQKGFSTKAGHPGIGLFNAQKIIRSYDNVLLETGIQDGCFLQHMELAAGKE